MTSRAAFKLICYLSLFFGMLLHLSCSQKYLNNVSEKPSFYAIVESSSFYTDYSTMSTIQKRNIAVYAQVHSEPIANSVQVTLNGKTADITDDHSPLISLGSDKSCYAVFIEDDFSGEKDIAITSDVGNASALISIPESLEFEGYKNLDTIPKYNDVQIKWHCNADYYAVLPKLCTIGA